MQQKTEQLSHYFPRNVNKREKRKDDAISKSKEENTILEEINEDLALRVERLEQKLVAANHRYENERKKVYCYKDKADKASKSKEEELKDLKENVSSLENENEKLKEEVENVLGKTFVQTFKDRKYTKEIRMVYYELLSMNLSVRNCEKVIRAVLEKLTNIEVDRLPTKSVASRLMVESRILAQMQVADAMIEGQHNVLHMDGTNYNFEEKGSFQVVTPSGSYTMSVEDMLSGEAECYLDTFRNVLHEMASLLVEPEEVEVKVAHLVASIKSLMTDRVVTNKSFCDQLKQWRENVLPLAIENYANLPDSEKSKIATINHVFCGLHVIHNLGCNERMGQAGSHHR